MKKLLKKVAIKNIEEYSTREAEFLPGGMEVIATPPSYAGRVILWTIMVLISCIFLWIILGTVDEVAVTNGKIIPNGYVRTLQADDKGIIKNIYVNEGQKVHKGDVLMELDPTVSAADLAKIQKSAAYAQLEFDRLTAEKEEHPFTPKTSAGVDEKDLAMEKFLYEERIAQYQTKFRAAQQQVMQAQSALRSANIEFGKQKDLYAIEANKENRLEILLEENAISEINLLDQRGKRISAENGLHEQSETVDEQSALLEKSKADLNAVSAERQMDIATNLLQAQQNLFNANEELKKASEKNELIKIIAPDDGYVSNLQVHTLGGIVTEAQQLMEIVPEGVSLEIESWAENKDIGFLKEGQIAEVKVETFNYQKFGTIPAKLISISPNAIEDTDKGRIYRLLLEPDRETIDVEGKKVQLSSGMSVTAEIKTRKKHIYEFFLEPFKKYQNEFLRER